VFAEGERYAIDHVGGSTVVRYEPWGALRPAHAAWADAFARDVGVNVPALAEASLDGVEIALRRPPPRDRDRYVALLGLTPKFGAATDEVRIPDAILAKPTRRADPMLAAFFERYLDALVSRLPADSFVGRAVAAIEPLLPGGSVELDAVAARMRVSTRTLQRRLSLAGTSFSDLVDRTRRSKALGLIDAGVAIGEIAWLMGYSEPSAFHRAFVRWTGTTPSAWRARRAQIP
jgi:AraC-like DNA-binding protein